MTLRKAQDCILNPLNSLQLQHAVKFPAYQLNVPLSLKQNSICFYAEQITDLPPTRQSQLAQLQSLTVVYQSQKNIYKRLVHY
jgi:hypothetical protein